MKISWYPNCASWNSRFGRSTVWYGCADFYGFPQEEKPSDPHQVIDWCAVAGNEVALAQRAMRRRRTWLARFRGVAPQPVFACRHGQRCGGCEGLRA